MPWTLPLPAIPDSYPTVFECAFAYRPYGPDLIFHLGLALPAVHHVGVGRDRERRTPPQTADSSEPANTPTFADSSWASASNASVAMKSDIEKPLPHSNATP